ncbi:MAG: thioredoxin family protein [Candidatus Shapirobacteria bacterium]
MKVVKIGAVWCSGCLVMGPRWKKLEKKNPWLKTEYYDYDQDRKKIKKWEVKGERLPVFVFVNNKGQEFLRLHGELPEKELEKIINQNKDR